MAELIFYVYHDIKLVGVSFMLSYVELMKFPEHELTIV